MSDAEALKNEGNARRAAGDLEGAAERYRGALALRPDYADALYNLGVVLEDAKRLAEAEHCFQRCRELDARDRDALFRLARVVAAQGRADDAIPLFREALALDPGNLLLWHGLAEACQSQGLNAEAFDAASRAVEIEPKFAPSHNLLGVLLQASGDVVGAIERYRVAVGLAPEDPASRNNLSCALALNGALDEAIAEMRTVIGLLPGLADAHANLGHAYSVKGRRDLALASYQEAYRLAPDDAALAANVLFESQHLCDWSRLEALIEVRRRNIGRTRRRTDPFSLLSIPCSRREQLLEAQAAARHEEAAMASERARCAFAFPRGKPARLKIGYLSSDLHEHATSYLAVQLFEMHDRARFEVVAYSYGPDDRSAMRARVRSAFDRFVEIGPLSHGEAARAIHADGVHILVDLKGYTTGARPGILALRPAPIQVNYLGFPGTMGAPFIDYLVGDGVITPPEHQADYCEKLVILPGSYQVNDRKRRVPPTQSRAALGLPADAFVFCCFNQPYKILPVVFDAWMRLLAAVPGSVLWLLEFNAWSIGNLRREAAARGVDPSRLVAAPMRPLQEHLSRIGAADLFLDTMPCNAHTSASDALWCGVPVLTCPGESFVSRVAASLLTASGMPELIADSLQEYEAMALRLAQSPAELKSLRERLATNRATCALFDTPAYVQAMEEAYERMWEAFATGRSPQQIDLR